MVTYLPGAVMPVIPIESPDDPRLADYRDLRSLERRGPLGPFIAEGRLIVSRLVEDRRYQIRSILVSDAAFVALDAAIHALPAHVPVFRCPADAFLPISGIDFHRGCLAIVERPKPVALDTLLARAALVVVLEAVANPDNVGGAFRNAAAFGADGVVLSPACCDPYYRKAIRTSMAATLKVPFAVGEPWPAALDNLRRAGLTIVALSPREDPGSVHPLALSGRGERMALLIGAEGDGLSAAAQAAADVRVRIPIAPAVDSLNLSVASGIALFAATARFRNSAQPIY